MRTLKDIKLTLGNHKKRLFKEYPIKSMAIFGSYSRSEQDNNSDLVSKKGIKEKYLKSIDSDLIYV